MKGEHQQEVVRGKGRDKRGQWNEQEQSEIRCMYENAVMKPIILHIVLRKYCYQRTKSIEVIKII